MDTSAFLERCFALRSQGTGVRTEVRAGLVTFLVRHEVQDYWWLKVPLGKRRPSASHTESWAPVGNGRS